ncbi:hypothetical protein BC628DRAFT_1401461 [Trametes gibbosa]|nr:hypothetical protein BC628DRAFT_1401461 [Trametes gibbosa]
MTSPSFSCGRCSCVTMQCNVFHRNSPSRPRLSHILSSSTRAARTDPTSSASPPRTPQGTPPPIAAPPIHQAGQGSCRTVPRRPPPLPSSLFPRPRGACLALVTCTRTRTDKTCRDRHRSRLAIRTAEEDCRPRPNQTLIRPPPNSVQRAQQSCHEYVNGRKPTRRASPIASNIHSSQTRSTDDPIHSQQASYPARLPILRRLGRFNVHAKPQAASSLGRPLPTILARLPPSAPPSPTPSVRLPDQARLQNAPSRTRAQFCRGARTCDVRRPPRLSSTGLSPPAHKYRSPVTRQAAHPSTRLCRTRVSPPPPHHALCGEGEVLIPTETCIDALPPSWAGRALLSSVHHDEL